MSSTKRSEILLSLSSAIKDSDDLLKSLKTLSDACDEITAFQHEYDYSPDHPANGFRSFVKVVDKFFIKLNHETEKKRFDAHLLIDYATVAKTLCKLVKMGMLVRKKGVNFDATKVKDEDYEFFDALFNGEESDFAPLLGPLSFFHQKTGLDSFWKRVLFMLHFSNSSVWDKVKMMCSTSFANASITKTIVNMNLKTCECFTPNGKYMIGLQVMNRLDTGGTRIDRINAVSSNKWLLTVPDPNTPAKILFVSERTATTSSLLIVPSNMDKGNKKVLMYLHGGAFISVTAEMTAGLMARTAKLMKLPILIPDYRKIPDHGYPAAWQDVFDVYMLLTSGDSDAIHQKLGFVANEVILFGDSAGATLSLALTFILNTLRKEHRAKLKMPAAIAVQYPCALPGFVSVPSFAILSIDPILSPGLVAMAAGFLVPVDPKLTDDQWYRNKDGTVRRTIERFVPRYQDPLFNLLAHPDYDDLKDISLYILGCELDPLLDHSILLAKKWRGRVELEIVPDICHGYISLYLHPLIRKELQTFHDHLSRAASQNDALGDNNNVTG